MTGVTTASSLRRKEREGEGSQADHHRGGEGVGPLS